jgi:hypothetical protein
MTNQTLPQTRTQPPRVRCLRLVPVRNESSWPWSLQTSKHTISPNEPAVLIQFWRTTAVASTPCQACPVVFRLEQRDLARPARCVARATPTASTDHGELLPPVSEKQTPRSVSRVSPLSHQTNVLALARNSGLPDRWTGRWRPNTRTNLARDLSSQEKRRYAV